VIIGLLATAVVRYVVPNIFKAQEGRVKSDIIVIVEALNEYAIDNQASYPDSLEALVTPDANGYRYLQQDKVPKDPWGEPYYYEPPERGQPDPRVYTLGADKNPGGGGKDQDIDNFMIRNQEV